MQMEPVHSWAENKSVIRCQPSFPSLKDVTYAHVADVLVIADGLVGLVRGGRTLRPLSVAVAGRPAAVVVAALVAHLQLAVLRTAGALAGAADDVRSKSAI